MIVDSLENSALYEHLNSRFAKAFEYLKTLDLFNLELGKTEILGKDLFIGITDSNLKSKENAALELHRKYIDIQIPVSKGETFGWKSTLDVKKEKAPFDEAKDIQFFEDTPTTYLNVEPGSFVIFFPQDAHAPCIGEGVIRKIVIKVLVD